MDLAVNRLKQIFKPSAYKCDSAEALKGGTSFPKILIVSLYYSYNTCLNVWI